MPKEVFGVVWFVCCGYECGEYGFYEVPRWCGSSLGREVHLEEKFSRRRNSLVRKVLLEEKFSQKRSFLGREAAKGYNGVAVVSCRKRKVLSEEKFSQKSR